MRRNVIYIWCFLMGVIIPGQKIIAADTPAEDNVKFSGTLVALPCTIPDSDQNIHVPMGTINAHDLYFNQPMRRVTFSLHLEDCDTSLAKSVSATFTGMESPGLPGLLAVDDSQSMASGIAVGIEDENGNALRLNQASSENTLLTGENILNFRAYIAGEPDAVKNRTIVTGGFIAIATLLLKYE